MSGNDSPEGCSYETIKAQRWLSLHCHDQEHGYGGNHTALLSCSPTLMPPSSHPSTLLRATRSRTLLLRAVIPPSRSTKSLTYMGMYSYIYFGYGGFCRHCSPGINVPFPLMCISAMPTAFLRPSLVRSGTLISSSQMHHLCFHHIRHRDSLLEMIRISLKSRSRPIASGTKHTRLATLSRLTA